MEINQPFEPLKKRNSVFFKKNIRRSKKRFSFLEDTRIKLGCGIFFVLLIFSIFGPSLTPYAYDQIHLSFRNHPPSKQFWLGTDDLGRDLFTRLWWGARISLAVGFIAALIDLILGVLWGSFAALMGGKADEFMMRICDCLYAIPYLLMVILLIVIIGPGFLTIILALTFTGWINMARIVRAKILQLKKLDYVLAARSLGASKMHIICKHLIPNSMGNIITTVLFTIPYAIFTEAFLSFLGLGVQAPVSSWGVLVADGINALRFYPWRLLFPACTLTLSIFSFYLVGDSLRDFFTTES